MKYLSIVFISLFILSCNKNEQLPIFACEVNGVAWNPKSVSVERNHENDLLILQIKDDTLSLILKIAADGINQYDLSSSSNHKAFVYLYHTSYVYPYESSFALSNGNFTISEISRFKKNMKGTFFFELYDDTGEKISFTNGKFSGYTYFD